MKNIDELENYIVKKNNTIIDSNFIKKLGILEVTKSEFINFWKQRNLISSFFEELLQKGIEKVKKSIGTNECINSYITLINNGNGLMIAGALLFLEYNIPEEYKKVKIARDYLFPEKFIINESNSDEIIKQKKLGIMYIDNHIIHDSKVHYPTLKLALEKYIDSETNFNFIKSGINIISEGKFKFYKYL